MTLLRLLGIPWLTCVFLVSLPSMAQAPAAPEFSKAELSATPAAVQSFLTLVDSGKYSEAWPMVSKHVQALSGPTVWAVGMRGLRTAAGPLKSRNAIAAGPVPADNKMPAGGRYFAVFYDASFANIETEEKVILSLEGGDWKVVGYFLSKCFGTRCG